MILRIPQVLTADELAAIRERLSAAPWVDGRATAGHQGAKVKSNLQIPEDSEEARALQPIVLRALERNGLFVSAALPRHVYPPMFNKYEPGMDFGTHIDGAIRQAGANKIRTDISATLFLNAPEDYEGGELLVEDTYGAHSVKLPAGDMVIYPATSLHRVTPVTKGARIACFFWIQSLVKDDSERALLFDMDRAIVELGQSVPNQSPAMLRLTAAYHNLVRKWTGT
ncbi:MAG TPA: Fe2+-dependent dioxygenase [Rhizomicrobium sp.]|nr:Fe2+-dependent dioxygenase [Rhizomicrobium sp.]